MATGQAAGGAPDRTTLLAFLGVVVLGGLNAIAVKATVADLDALWGAGSRFAVAGVLLIAIVAITRRSIPRGQSLAGALAYGVLSFAASYGLLYVALREVPAGTAMVFLALVPLMTFGLAILHRQERFRAQGLIGALVALAGVAIVVADQLSAEVPIGAMLLVLLGTLCIAESGVIVKWIPRSDPFATNGVAMLTGAVVLILVSVSLGETWALPAEQGTWAAMIYLVVLGSIAMFGLYVFALKRWTASAMSYVTLLMPLVTVPIAAVLLAEQVTVLFLLGSGVALLGVYVGAFLTIRPRRSTQTSLPECLPVDDCADAAAPTTPQPATR
jgi:drug/metabolite transporter (DMT)-like permease